MTNDDDGVWRTICGRRVFIRKGQSISDAMRQSGKFKRGKDGKLLEPVKSSKSVSTCAKNNKKKMTPAEKIASVHIDFDRDNILPELNESELQKIGVEKNKPILLKKSVIERNRKEHDDITDSDFEEIVKNALYAPSEVFPANKEKPYYHFAKVIEINSKGKPEIGLVLLDVDNKKDNFEIVHVHFVDINGLKRYKKKKD